MASATACTTGRWVTTWPLGDTAATAALPPTATSHRPEIQHARIATHYLDSFATDWRAADSYGLRNVVGHLAAAAAAETVPAKRGRRTAALYGLVLDPAFQAAQKECLGNLNSTLADLRLAIETALAGDEVVPLLQCVASFREVARSGAIAGGIFDAAGRRRSAIAIRDAEHYGPPPRPRGRWARVLNAWIAWQAAQRNDPKAARQAAEGVVSQWSTAGARPSHSTGSCAERSSSGPRKTPRERHRPRPVPASLPAGVLGARERGREAARTSASDAKTTKLLETLSGRLRSSKTCSRRTLRDRRNAVGQRRDADVAGEDACGTC